MAENQHSVAEAGLWATFSRASNAEEVFASWLALQCGVIGRVSGALVIARTEEDSLAPVAIWPDVRRDMSYLAEAAQRCLSDQRSTVLQAPAQAEAAEPNWHIAYPVQVHGDTEAIVALDLNRRGEDELQAVLRQLHWGSAWLSDFFIKQRLAKAEANVRQSSKLFKVLARFLSEEKFQRACISVVNELARSLDCSRVSLGTVHKGTVVVRAISNVATFDKRTQLVSAIGKAMDEAYDQQRSVVAPERESLPPAINMAHTELVRDRQAGTVLSVPLLFIGRPIGSLTMERADGREFSDETVRLAETLGEMLGPLVEEKRKNDRWIGFKMAEAFRELAGKFVGPGHLTLKFFSALTLLIVLFFTVMTMPFRISAPIVVEGKTQRAVSAPFEGFIKASHHRAGETVKAGELLAEIDDREYRLEQTRYRAEIEQYRHKKSDAFARGERANVGVLEAQIAQAQAQLDGAEDKLAQTRLMAPYDGVIVSGDLSQKIGSRVELGQVLFEVAPLNDYRVILKVDERDIHEINTEQKGELTLSGISNERLPFKVAKIVSMSTAEEGRNFFPVEASLLLSHARIRPGMEGVGKIEIGERKLIWVWSRRLMNWIGLKWWEWTS